MHLSLCRAVSCSAVPCIFSSRQLQKLDTALQAALVSTSVAISKALVVRSPLGRHLQLQAISHRLLLHLSKFGQHLHQCHPFEITADGDADFMSFHKVGLFPLMFIIQGVFFVSCGVSL